MLISKNFLIMMGVAAAVGLVVGRRYVIEPPAQFAVAIDYNRSIHTEYGVPIKVAKAIDGDTIELINGDRVRYNGIDTPEEFDTRKPVQCYAKEAAERNKELVEGKMITIYKDISDRDKYNRWIGFIYLADGTLVNKTLVAEGYAFAYPYKPDISKAPEFKKAETLAHAHGLGLWSHCSVRILTTGREQTNAVKP